MILDRMSLGPHGSAEPLGLLTGIFSELVNRGLNDCGREKESVPPARTRLLGEGSSRLIDRDSAGSEGESPGSIAGRGLVEVDRSRQLWFRRRMTGYPGLRGWNFYNPRGGPGGQLWGPPMRGVPRGVDQFEPPLTPSDVQVSGCWSIPARYASIRRVPTGISSSCCNQKITNSWDISFR